MTDTSQNRVQSDSSAEAFRERFGRMESELGRVIVGQGEVIRQTLLCLIGGGHSLLEGVPGLGKTLLVRTLSQVMDLSFSRIQFTPDLMPADITGTNILLEEEGQRRFQFQPGPLFAQIVLADEINRATPKTQSAMLEAMQEKSVTVAGQVRRLQEPFFVLATQNPIEMEGTYPLPEAQLDRFLFKIMVPPPSLTDLSAILDRTTGVETPSVSQVLTSGEVLDMQSLTRSVPMAPHVRDYISSLIRATHPDSENAHPLVRKYVRVGSSPRGAQAIALTAKTVALLAGRYNVAIEDIHQVAAPALRHRILLNFEGEADDIQTADVVQKIIEFESAARKTTLT